MSDTEMTRVGYSDFINQLVMAMMESDFGLRLVNMEKQVDDLKKSTDDLKKSMDEQTKILKEFLHVSEVKKA
ncbi:hypothetical protein HG530_006676 [Fusarium avenaceum]|nr:hypothetical protein HG530_006676 [Fusarium avenaceum]